MSRDGSNDHQLVHDEVRAHGYLEQIPFMIEHEETRTVARRLPRDVDIISKQNDSNPLGLIIEPTQQPTEELVEVAGPDLVQPSEPLLQRLPLELLSEIFVYCLPHGDFHRPNKHETPLLIAQVSTFWRKVALNTPRLWASLEIFTERQNADGTTSSRLLVDINELWLSRSKQYPLSLSLQDSCVLVAHDFVLSTIRSHSSHLRYLKMNIPMSDCVFFPEDAYLPLLETFEMVTEDGLELDLLQSFSNCLIAVPRLKSFTWNNRFLDFSPLKLKWSNLTYLKLNTAITLQDCLPLFLEAKVMTHITLGFVIAADYAVAPSVVLPELQSLIFCAGDNPGPMFEAIAVPKLKELVINSRFWPHASIKAFLRRSACPLESFNLYCPPLNEAEFIECLEIVQRTLKEFTVHSSSPIITDAVLERLTDTELNKDFLCPKLEVIALYNCISCSPGKFAAMAQSRLNIDAQSETQLSARPRCTLTLKVMEMYDDEVERIYLMPLRSLGLIVKVYSSVDGTEIAMEPENDVRLRQLHEEGRVTSVYEWASWTIWT